MEKVRIGVIGCGNIAVTKHLPAMQHASARCEIVGFCDMSLERAEGARALFGAPGSYSTDDYKRVVEDRTIDAVHIFTPNNTHCEIAVAAAAAKKHILVEKPLAATGGEAHRIADAAKRSGVLLTVGYQNRFRDDSVFLKNVIGEGRLGEIYFAKAHAVRRRSVPTWGVFTNRALQGGGPLIDIGTHALDLALWYMDNYEIASVSGAVYDKLKNKPDGNRFGPWDPESFDVEDSAFGFIRMKNGASVFLEAAWALNTTDVREASCTLCGVEGGAETFSKGGEYSCKINAVAGKRLVVSEPDFTERDFRPDVVKETPGDRELAAWLDAIVDGKPLVVLPEQACVVSDVLDAVYQSAATGETVYFG